MWLMAPISKSLKGNWNHIQENKRSWTRKPPFHIYYVTSYHPPEEVPPPQNSEEDPSRCKYCSNLICQRRWKPCPMSLDPPIMTDIHLQSLVILLVTSIHSNFTAKRWKRMTVIISILVWSNISLRLLLNFFKGKAGKFKPLETF